jgi:hypothetical protein
MASVFKTEGLKGVTYFNGRDSVFIKGFLQQTYGEEETRRMFESLNKEEYIDRNDRTMRYRAGTLARDKFFMVDSKEKFPVYGYPSRQWAATAHYRLIADCEVVQKLVAHVDNNVAPAFAINHVIGTRYNDKNDYIGFHSDKTVDINPGSPIVMFSFGGTRTMTLAEIQKGADGNPVLVGPKNNTKVLINHVDFTMEHGDCFVLGWNTNKDFQHSIVKSNEDTDPRISLVMRDIITRLSPEELAKKVHDAEINRQKRETKKQSTKSTDETDDEGADAEGAGEDGNAVEDGVDEDFSTKGFRTILMIEAMNDYIFAVSEASRRHTLVPKWHIELPSDYFTMDKLIYCEFVTRAIESGELTFYDPSSDAMPDTAPSTPPLPIEPPALPMHAEQQVHAATEAEPSTTPSSIEPPTLPSVPVVAPSPPSSPRTTTPTREILHAESSTPAKHSDEWTTPSGNKRIAEQQVHAAKSKKARKENLQYVKYVSTSTSSRAFDPNEPLPAELRQRTRFKVVTTNTGRTMYIGLQDDVDLPEGFELKCGWSFALQRMSAPEFNSELNAHIRKPKQDDRRQVTTGTPIVPGASIQAHVGVEVASRPAPALPVLSNVPVMPVPLPLSSASDTENTRHPTCPICQKDAIEGQHDITTRANGNVYHSACYTRSTKTSAPTSYVTSKPRIPKPKGIASPCSCDIQFPTKSAMFKHHRDVHPGEFTAELIALGGEQCPLCPGSVFVRLKVHTSQEHRGECTASDKADEEDEDNESDGDSDDPPGELPPNGLSNPDHLQAHLPPEFIARATEKRLIYLNSSPKTRRRMLQEY